MAAWLALAVCEGGCEAVDDVAGETVGVTIGVASGDGVGVTPGEGVGVTTGDGVGVTLGVGVGVTAGDGVGVTAGDGVGVLHGMWCEIMCHSPEFPSRRSQRSHPSPVTEIKAFADGAMIVAALPSEAMVRFLASGIFQMM